MSDYLETYSGRDKMLKTLSYAAKLLTVCTSSESTEKKFKTFGSQMSECRVMLRLLDDLPTLNFVMTYGWGKQVFLFEHELIASQFKIKNYGVEISDQLSEEYYVTDYVIFLEPFKFHM